MREAQLLNLSVLITSLAFGGVGLRVLHPGFGFADAGERVFIHALEWRLASGIAIRSDHWAGTNEMMDGILADFSGAGGVWDVVVHGRVCVVFLTTNKTIINESFLLYRQGGEEATLNHQ